MKTSEHRAATRLLLCNVIRDTGAILDRLTTITEIELLLSDTAPDRDKEAIARLLAEAQNTAAELSEAAKSVEDSLERYAHHVASEKLKEVAS